MFNLAWHNLSHSLLHILFSNWTLNIYHSSSFFSLSSSFFNSLTCVKQRWNLWIAKFLNLHLICFVKNLFHSHNFRDVKLQHILDPILQCDNTTRTGGARTLHRTFQILGPLAKGVERKINYYHENTQFYSTIKKSKNVK